MYLYVFSAYQQVFWKEIQADTVRYMQICTPGWSAYLYVSCAYHQVFWHEIQADTDRYMQICTPLVVHICMYLPVFLIHVLKIHSDMHKIHLWEEVDTYRYMQIQRNTCMYVSDMHCTYLICTWMYRVHI